MRFLDPKRLLAQTPLVKPILAQSVKLWSTGSQLTKSLFASMSIAGLFLKEGLPIWPLGSSPGAAPLAQLIQMLTDRYREPDKLSVRHQMACRIKELQLSQYYALKFCRNIKSGQYIAR